MVMEKLEKARRFPELFCEDCLTDPDVKCPRNKDVRCIHCGKELCGYHIVKHLEEEHVVSITWQGLE